MSALIWHFSINKFYFLVFFFLHNYYYHNCLLQEIKYLTVFVTQENIYLSYFGEQLNGWRLRLKLMKMWCMQRLLFHYNNNNDWYHISVSVYISENVCGKFIIIIEEGKFRERKMFVTIAANLFWEGAGDVWKSWLWGKCKRNLNIFLLNSF